ncbi:undecaprenyl-diphosphate phosphatase [Rhodobacteraceae bacterium 2CG4]|uniref:Undecaprenyl-diphosphatase n=1 Tax=Halovulum marinum TaxID=2662447 RepID=A0A6L5Z4X6_9RHOB|nr:undecaprenyl-diphosphate phosphatase [Halovulum marinum]MSU91573.1 undecaprenyl-diphosphate phosphatase [Halovulum marinum]
MPLLSLLMLALIQGITEFLPVSSSAHLELWHQWVGQTPDDLSLDIAVHVGTLAAATLYFRAEVGSALAGVLQLLRGERDRPEAQLAIRLVVATVPVVLAGGALALTGLTEALRSLAVIGWAMILFGLLLWWFDRRGARGRRAADWTLRDAWIMGLWQALALIPGTSRSGAAITGALAQGYERSDGARLAMLMSIPTIAASGVLLVGKLVATGNVELGAELALAAALAFGAGLAALALMLRLLRSVSFTPYVVYRVLLGLLLLGIAYS